MRMESFVQHSPLGNVSLAVPSLWPVQSGGDRARARHRHLRNQREDPGESHREAEKASSRTFELGLWHVNRSSASDEQEEKARAT